ncbi:MAG: polyribonucleotide nucleotidyltransferase [Desulfitibacter sp. BRH_c19]|nr:MAG: polyribonucleotide nucleotidyltransferase [Desulfitibacter sp. BRH_c19]
MATENLFLEKALDLGGGKTLTLQTGKLAKQASGSVLVKFNDTTVLAAATASDEPREGIDFFPLTVDYEERLYAVGKIPGGFIKREGRPSEKAILSSRLIDRPIRPLFPEGYRNDVQIVTTVLSVDQDCPPDITAIIGASVALTISKIPFLGPIAAVSVGYVNGQVVVNPSLNETENSVLHLVVAGTKDGIMMVESKSKEVGEEIILEAMEKAHLCIKDIIGFIEKFKNEAQEMGLVTEKQKVEIEQPSDEVKSKVEEIALPKIKELFENASSIPWEKAIREKQTKEVKKQIIEKLQDIFAEELLENPNLLKSIKQLMGKIEKKVLRTAMLETGIRIDGRKINEIRPISCEVGLLARTHGTGLFNRGETQVLTVATLGAVRDEQVLDGLGVEESKRYMHHYNFPPYSVGEARFMRGPGRREIGHGALAEKALEAVIPTEDSFPYTIRVVSEVIGSNGSTSMGSVCGSTLSLMDAGVPIKAPVAGIAMGLVKEDDKVEVLSDIQGVEDALGDMDFKVAGTKEGITALQMDIKVAGIDVAILKGALDQAKEGRLHILGKMLEVLSEPRAELSPYSPRIVRMQVDPDKIRDIIGPGGKIIKKIVEQTGAKIDIEDDGTVFVAAIDGKAGENAQKLITALTQDVEIGKIYMGKVTRVTDFGAFVEVIEGVLGLPGKEGLVHISQLDVKRVEKVEDIVKEGEQVMVKAISFDQQGRLKLSRKEALPGYESNNDNSEKNERPRKKSFSRDRS